MSTSPILEHDLAIDLGVSRDVVREIRRQKLRPDVDWFTAFKAIHITPRGVELIRGYLGSQNAKNAPARAAGSAAGAITVTDDELAAPKSSTVTMLRVHKLVINPHILLASDGARVVRVRVQNTKNFRVGMEIPATHIQADLFELARACPRRPGQW